MLNARGIVHRDITLLFLECLAFRRLIKLFLRRVVQARNVSGKNNWYTLRLCSKSSIIFFRKFTNTFTYKHIDLLPAEALSQYDKYLNATTWIEKYAAASCCLPVTQRDLWQSHRKTNPVDPEPFDTRRTMIFGFFRGRCIAFASNRVHSRKIEPTLKAYTNILGTVSPLQSRFDI